jgi:hypothetical protein
MLSYSLSLYSSPFSPLSTWPSSTSLTSLFSLLSSLFPLPSSLFPLPSSLFFPLPSSLFLLPSNLCYRTSNKEDHFDVLADVDCLLASESDQKNVQFFDEEGVYKIYLQVSSVISVRRV